MKNRKWISLAVSALLSVTALPTMAFAEAAATEAVKVQKSLRKSH